MKRAALSVALSCVVQGSLILSGGCSGKVASPPSSPVAGVCGAAASAATTSAPTSNLCASGTASIVTGNGPFSWTCGGSRGGSNSSCSAPLTSQQSGTEIPGPSAALFASPFYTCLNNFYVATDGDDGNDGTTQTSDGGHGPWLTIQQADSSPRQAGDCINVEPGTYANGARISRGGNLASATGYVVYRCTELDACKVTDSSYGFSIVSTGDGPNYVVFDGFELAASSEVTYGQGIYVWDGNENGSAAPPSSHHIWVLNNIIHDFGQSGVQMNDGEYFYVIHNATYDNANVTCDAQGSGISFVVEKAFAGYTSNATDAQYAPFHNVVSWNVSYANILTQCGNATNQYDTDGNGIIMDTFDNQGSTNVLYPYQSLVAFNLTYGNGAKGIQVFRTSYVTVANNTSYDNNLDPFNNGTARGEINQAGGHGNTYINNIAYPLPATSVSDARCQGTNPCYLMDNAAFLGGDSAGETDANNAWSNNISFGGTPPYGNEDGNAVFDADAINCSGTGADPNKCNVNPLLTSPAASNFALSAGSPAIGYGLTESYLSPQSVDVGACSSKVTVCPQ
jgi:hypothetical protein